MNWYHERNWRPMSGAVAVGLLVFGLSLQVAPADSGGSEFSSEDAASVDRSTGGPRVVTQATHERDMLRAPLRPEAAERLRDQDADIVGAIETRVHFAKVIGSSPVSSANGAGASRAAGILQIGDPCDCDEDCDGSLADQCNIMQCIVRGVCSLDPTITCTTSQAGGSADAICNAAEAGVCQQASFRQRCDLVQLNGFPCESGNGFCHEDVCRDDGLGTETSICVPQFSGLVIQGALSPCAKQCLGGAAAGLRCDRSSQCPQGDCIITGGGLCDNATNACYVGVSVATATGRCCTGTTCTETDEATCTGAIEPGTWLRYTDPEQLEGDLNCICPKYGSGVAPVGSESASQGPVRPSGLVCTAGSAAADLAGLNPVYCEDDGTGFSPQFCLRRCTGGDNIGALCEVDNPDCGRSGLCSIGGLICLVQNNGEDCGLCEGLTDVGCDTEFNPCPGGETCLFEGGQTCPATNPGQCTDDPCASNAIEGGCETGFLNIGDDYSLKNGSYLRLTQFRFRGGITNQNEDIIFEIWDSTGTRLVDTLQVEIQTGGVVAPTQDLPLTGTRDWTIEVDCWPNCNPNQLEVPQPNPVIIPPNGYIVMRSVRTIGTLNGATAFWSQTTDPVNDGLNDSGKSWLNGNPNANVGSNVYIFELVGVKVPDPFGACCDQGGSVCNDTLRWECGQCTPDSSPGCSNTLLDCPEGGLTGSVCQFNKWFGPISHSDFEFGGADNQLCGGPNNLSPCDKGGCCQGGLDGSCTVEEEGACAGLGGIWLGPATDCDPDCCPKTPVGVDCICETWNCVIDATGVIPGFVCDPANGDDDCDPGQTCTFSCAPDPANITLLRHPHECHDDFGSPLEPPVPCDPNNGDADCTAFDLLWTCEQSFTTAVTTSKTDTIDSFFGVLDGDACSLNTTSDRIGWFERFTLVDPTPGDGADDCFVVTVSMCCTDPVLTPIWAFLSQFLECPCFESSDVFGIAPDSDIGNNLKSGFGPASLSNFPCEDENYAGTFTVPPGDYAYQIRAGKICVGSTPTQSCDSAADCEGVACILGTPDYTLHYTIESCQLAACCVNEACIITNELDCQAQRGNFLGGGDQPIVTCAAGACTLGSCCLTGTCNDDEFHDTKTECEGAGGEYFGGVGCDAGPCPACPFHFPENCQQVQTIFGLVPSMERNPANGSDEKTAAVSADDVKFGGSEVDTICWNTGFFVTPCCASGSCAQNIDNSWEVRIYEDNVDAGVGCDAIPGAEIGFSTIRVLNKIEGTGQGTGTWLYSGSLNAPITLTGNPGLAGDTYWMEVSGFGEPDCAVFATWSRDHGNDHHAVSTWEAPEPAAHPYTTAQVGSVDMGLCEDSGLGTPPDVLGVCCTCSAEGPGVCTENFTQKDCVQNLRGVWVACADCSDPSATCPGVPVNDDVENATVIPTIPTDGSELLIEDQNNICATDDGPGLQAGDGGCATSLGGDADMHNDVWWSYTAEECGDLTVDSCEDTDAMDQMIAIYDGGNGLPLLRTDEIGCGDDTCGPGAGPSTVTVRVTAGRVYYIRAGGWNNAVPGGFIGSPRGVFTLHLSLDANCPAVVAPGLACNTPGGRGSRAGGTCAPGEEPILKNRYISIRPGGDGDVNPPNLDIKVVMTGSEINGVTGIGTEFWATGPFNGGGLSPATCIAVVEKVRPENPPDWSGCPVVHLTGCPIVPTSTFAISVIDSDGTESAGALEASTQAKPGVKWTGDCVGFFDGNVWTPPNGVTSIDDAVAAIKTFQDPTALNATHLSVTDMVPNLNGSQINLIVNINDVLDIILGFQGNEYPGADRVQCP